MLSIVYSSTAERPFTDEDLDALLAQSRATNERLGLTGVLVYRDHHFLQLIEGPADVVHERMHAIEQDPRHARIRVLLEDEVLQRQFPDWTMGFDADGHDPVTTPGFRRTFDDIDSDRSAAGTLPALRALLGWFRERHDA